MAGTGELNRDERLNQLNAELPKLQTEVDLMKVNRISEDEILHEATSLYDRWPSLPWKTSDSSRPKDNRTATEKASCGTSFRQADVAKELGVHSVSISNWERGTPCHPEECW